MSDLERINWIRRNPAKLIPRFAYEVRMAKSYFPHARFQFLDSTTEIVVECPIVSRSKNLYRIRIFFPDEYPNSAPVVTVADPDVLEFCRVRGLHEYHNFGAHQNGGLQLCLFHPGDPRAVGWVPDQTVTTALNLAACWVNSYEHKRSTGFWPFPE